MSDNAAAERRAAVLAAQDRRLLALINAGKLARPDNELLANMYRRRGDLVAAFAECDRLQTGGIATPTVHLFQAIGALRRAPAPPPPSAFAAAPFVIVDQFLDPALNRAALDDAVARQAVFTDTALQHDATYAEAQRATRVTFEVGDAGAVLRARVADQLPLLCERLNMPLFDIRFIQLKIAAYGNGDFFKVHQDNGVKHPERRISFVYYFNEEPKRYAGGDLLLYDSRFSPRAYVSSLFTRFIPRNNSLIAFPSEYFHEVTAVTTADAAFRSSRFTLAGHIG